MKVVVVGAGIGGVRLAQALRRNGFDGELTVIGEEEPYDRPPLSKAFLAGSVDRAGIDILRGDDSDLDLRIGRAVRLDLSDKEVELEDGDRIAYDKLVIATGVRARPSPWQPSSGVHVLRTLQHCRALSADLAQGGDVVIVGAGFIGSEVASTCRTLGHVVTLIDPLALPMARFMGDELGQLMADLHENHGVSTRFGVGVEAITGVRGDLTVRLTDGTSLECAVAVVGIGAEPNDEWLRNSGLVIDDGVECDGSGLTSDPDVYAIGDVARWAGERVEHWTNAIEQAAAVARSLTARPATARAAGFVWSDQHDAKVTIVGEKTHAVTVLRRENEAVALFGDIDGTLAGGATLNWPKASIALRKALRVNMPLEQALAELQK